MPNKIIIIVLIIIVISGFLQANWILQHSGDNTLFDIDFPPGNIDIGYACGVNSFILKTINSGENWSQLINVESSGVFHAINFPNDQMTGYIACDEGNVQLTTDAGERWVLVNTGTRENLFGIHFVNNEVGFVVGAAGKVFVTHGAGLVWDEMSIPINHDLYEVYFINGEKGYVVGDSGTIAYTQDGGMNWEIQNSDVTTHLRGVYFIDQENGWVVGEAKTCLKTTDGGQHWEPVDIPLPTNTFLYSVIFPVDMSTGFVCGSMGRIAKTTDAGNSWETDTNLIYDFYRIEFPRNNITGWVCGMSEVIYKNTEGGWIEEVNHNRTAEQRLISCVPNPFRSSTCIRLLCPIQNKVPLKLFDRSGSLVRNLTLNKNGTVNWDGRNESNLRVKFGIYFLKVVSDDNITQPIKLVLLD
jgi:photosystem II stability/assembly factor-like uncharacterized protein